MSRFIEGCDHRQKLLLPDCIDDYVAGDTSVRVVDMFVGELELGFEGAAASRVGEQHDRSDDCDDGRESQDWVIRGAVRITRPPPRQAERSAAFGQLARLPKRRGLGREEPGRNRRS